MCVAFLFSAGPARAADSNTNAGPDTVAILEIAGSAEVLKSGEQLWLKANPNQILRPGDSFRTKRDSRATLRLSDRSQLRVGAESLIQIQAPAAPQAAPAHKLWRGLIYFFHRDKPGQFRFDSPSASAAVRGTEFVMSVDDAGRTVLTLLDGEVVLSNAAGQADLHTGQQGVAEPGRAPAVTAMLHAQLQTAVQWGLYYPGVLHLPELGLTADETAALHESLAAWREGDLLAALQLYPAGRAPASDGERNYRAGLLLAVGQTEPARQLLDSVREERQRALAESLLRLIAAVGGSDIATNFLPDSATAWLAESYVFQSRSDLSGSMAAAAEAARRAPDFAFARARLAELEFGSGLTTRAENNAGKALALAPRNAQALALKGFLVAARNKPSEAMSWFGRAIAVDGALGNAWLGRGLCKIRQGQTAAGVLDLQTAATLEPQRALLRSYLGKGYEQARFSSLAARELDLALRLDPKDPTPWLYRALLQRGENRINSAVASLEHSIDLNDNRSLYRSRLLLDQDRAVRGANLARIYQDAAMNEVSLGEAARSVTADYANASAHLFLSDSYEALRDPTRFNLRHETIWFNELLLGNLLAPVGAGHLSQHVSQQEYSRLFEADRLGLFSSTEYRSDGQFRQIASQSGLWGDTAWSLDLDYQRNDGVRPNNDLNRIDWYSTIKHQFTPRDSALAIVRYQDYSSGDNFQYYDPAQARPNLRIEATQTPTLLAGYHHEWAPGVHTLLTGGRLQSDQRVTDRFVTNSILTKDINGDVVDIVGLGLDLAYRSRLEIYTVEAQQIFQGEKQSLILGGRFQSGDFDSFDQLTVSDPGDAFFLDNMPSTTNVLAGFQRLSGYGYYTVEPVNHLRLTAGVSCDEIKFPVNFRQPPLASGTERRSQLNPKAALVWSPAATTTLRAAYSRALGGASFDESVRLEPSQSAGFGQAFRTLIPESVAGSVAAPEFETLGAALDLRMGAKTYATVQGEVLRQDVDRQLGVFALNVITPLTPATLRQQLAYEERSVSVAVNQLLGDDWTLGAQYRFADATLRTVFPELPAPVAARANRDEHAQLHRARLHALYHHPCGFFARAETEWYAQHNSGYSTALPGDDFFQHNLYVGYRFPRRRAEILLGVLNLAGHDYRLNPLNIYHELPRERVFLARLKFDF